ncbi:MAG TPA: methyltransferase [Bacteroidetes bacterium]|nr:methyltransferase [Bacteroidota bacterium]
MTKRDGPSKYELIWETVRQVPRGTVATYGEVAEQSGFPGQPRLVGYALHHLPRGTDVPWHRVINAQGKISLPREDGTYVIQKQLLQGEGIVFARERIDLNRFGWLRRSKKQFHSRRHHR